MSLIPVLIDGNISNMSIFAWFTHPGHLHTLEGINTATCQSVCHLCIEIKLCPQCLPYVWLQVPVKYTHVCSSRNWVKLSRQLIYRTCICPDWHMYAVLKQFRAFPANFKPKYNQLTLSKNTCILLMFVDVNIDVSCMAMHWLVGYQWHL